MDVDIYSSTKYALNLLEKMLIFIYRMYFVILMNLAGDTILLNMQESFLQLTNLIISAQTNIGKLIRTEAYGMNINLYQIKFGMIDVSYFMFLIINYENLLLKGKKLIIKF